MWIKFFIFLTIVHKILATTEWFGDLRAHLNPPKSPPFYDVTYDDTECPLGLQSNAIPDYVYFGEMIATLTVTEHTECLEQCLSNPKCNAVNFFEPMSYQEKGFCELLTETQVDNPRLMRPFKKAIYYEKIRCRTEEDEEENVGKNDKNDNGDDIHQSEKKSMQKMPVRTPEARKFKIMKLDEKQSSIPSESIHDSSHSKEVTKPEVPVVESNFMEQNKDSMTNIMKKIADKVHEFNLLFRSR